MQTNTAGSALHASHLLFSISEPEYTSARDGFHSSARGYQRNIEHTRQTDFTRVRDVAYLDCAGAALYSETQVQAAINQLQETLFCNPHSQNGPGSASAEAEASLRLRTLQMCNASGQEYDVILTSGATASLKLVAECFPWTASSKFEYTRGNHNSVLGIRAVALERGATVQAVELKPNRSSGGHETTSGSAAAFNIKPCGAPMNFSDSSESKNPRHACQAISQDITSRASQMTTAHDEQPAAHSGSVCLVPETLETSALHQHAPRKQHPGSHNFDATYHLFAYPPECNFSGLRTHGSVVQQVHLCCSHTTASPLSAAQLGSSELSTPTPASCTSGCKSKTHDADSSHSKRCSSKSSSNSRPCTSESDEQRQGHWLVLMDAAKACSTQPPDLSQHPAEFVTVSYYKIFGYPTGLGALLVRKSVLPLLRKTYFGGGTLSMVLAAQDRIVRRSGHSGFEDGTLPYTSISAALHGFAFIDHLGGFPLISAHAGCLADHLASQLVLMHHSNGSPVCVVYGRTHQKPPATHKTTQPRTGCDHDGTVSAHTAPPHSSGRDHHGPTVAFNLLDDQGGAVGHAEVARLAGLHGVILRAGCFCNPGACEKFLGLRPEDVLAQHAAGHVCWDDVDLIEGRPTGALRASLGHVSTFQEVYALLKLIRRYFVSNAAQTATLSAIQLSCTSINNLTAAPTAPDGHQTCEGAHSPLSDPAANLSLIDTRFEGGVCASSLSSGNLTRSRSTSPGSSSSSAINTLSAISDADTGSQVHTHLQHSSHWDATTSSSSHSQAPPTATHDLRMDGPFLHNLHLQAAHTKSACLPPGNEMHPSLSVDELDEGFVSCEEDLQPNGDQIDTVLIGDHAHAFQVHHRIERLEQGRSTAGMETISGSHTNQRPIQTASSEASKLECCSTGTEGVLTHIYLYPIKSCAPQQAEAWPVGSNGLLFDREWALVDDSSKVVTQKACPRMATLQPHIELASGTLTISAHKLPGLKPLVVALDSRIPSTSRPTSLHLGSHGQNVTAKTGLTREQVTVCGESVCGTLVLDSMLGDDDAARSWFMHALGMPCRLVRQQDRARLVKRPTGSISATQSNNNINNSNGGGSSSGTGSPHSHDTAASSELQTPGPAPSIGFANDGQYLLVNEASLSDLNTRMAAGHESYGSSSTGPQGGKMLRLGDTEQSATTPQVDIRRFRPNLVVSGFAPYEEDSWSSVSVGALQCGVLGTCPRCEMLQVDQSAGVRVKADVLIALAQYRRRGGKVHFGVLLAAERVPQLKQSDSTETARDGGSSNILDSQPAPSPHCQGSAVGENVLSQNDYTHPTLQISAICAKDGVQNLNGECGVLTGLSIVCVGDVVKPRK